MVQSVGAHREQVRDCGTILYDFRAWAGRKACPPVCGGEAHHTVLDPFNEGVWGGCIGRLRRHPRQFRRPTRRGERHDDLTHAHCTLWKPRHLLRQRTQAGTTLYCTRAEQAHLDVNGDLVLGERLEPVPRGASGRSRYRSQGTQGGEIVTSSAWLTLAKGGRTGRRARPSLRICPPNCQPLTRHKMSSRSGM